CTCPPVCSCLSICVSSCSRAPRALPSFPTRRSSDLALQAVAAGADLLPGGQQQLPVAVIQGHALPGNVQLPAELQHRFRVKRRRSEEHTSELQSRENLVCRLLLEKKKTEKS